MLQSNISIKNTTSLQQGISLMEVLVSLLILSIGLLGVAGLQGTSLKNTREANTKTNAIVLAQDIIDSMRANRTHVITGTGGQYALALDEDLTPAPAPCNPVACLPSAVADIDLFNWWDQIDATNGTRSTFANGKAAITVTDPTGLGQSALVTVLIQWTEIINEVSTPMNYRLKTLI